MDYDGDIFLKYPLFRLENLEFQTKDLDVKLIW